MKRKLLLLCVATLLALAATGQTPVRQKPPRGRWGAEVNTYVAPFIDGAISVDGIYNYAVADWFIVGAGAGVLHSATSYSNYTALMYGRAFVRLRFEVPKWRVPPFFSRISAWEYFFPDKITILSGLKAISSSEPGLGCATTTG